jgi:heterodisulfide reductase subunit A2
MNKDGVSEIVPAKCQGCGICPSECPARAITLKHSTDSQTVAEIDAFLDKIDFESSSTLVPMLCVEA